MPHPIRDCGRSPIVIPVTVSSIYNVCQWPGNSIVVGHIAKRMSIANPNHIKTRKQPIFSLHWDGGMLAAHRVSRRGGSGSQEERAADEQANDQCQQHYPGEPSLSGRVLDPSCHRHNPFWYCTCDGAIDASRWQSRLPHPGELI